MVFVLKSVEIYSILYVMSMYVLEECHKNFLCLYAFLMTLMSISNFLKNC